MNFASDIVPILMKYEYLGTRVLENGTFLIGKVPHIGSKAFLHKIYAPLNQKNISTLQEILKTKIPTEYEEFLYHANGLNIFSDALSLHGLRFNYKRDGDNIYQPYHLNLFNIEERLKDSKADYFYIGSYSADGSRLYIDQKSGFVFRCDSISSSPLNSWQSLEELLTSELARIGAQFDENGKKIDANRATSPAT